MTSSCIGYQGSDPNTFQPHRPTTLQAGCGGTRSRSQPRFNRVGRRSGRRQRRRRQQGRSLSCASSARCTLWLYPRLVSRSWELHPGSSRELPHVGGKPTGGSAINLGPGGGVLNVEQDLNHIVVGGWFEQVLCLLKTVVFCVLCWLIVRFKRFENLLSWLFSWYFVSLVKYWEYSCVQLGYVFADSYRETTLKSGVPCFFLHITKSCGGTAAYSLLPLTVVVVFCL